MAAEESLASSRPSRSNAGNRMSKLIDDEQEVDDFYKTAFGGFEEVEDDKEYADEEEDVDVVDSDFSNSETDEVIEQDDEPKRKRKKVVIKAYKKRKDDDDEDEKKPKEPKAKKVDAKPREGLRKSSRSLTISKVEEHKRRQHQETEKRKLFQIKQRQHQVKVPAGMRRLTQEELLAEAKITEEENTAFLLAYQRHEADKKKTKIQKVTHKGPVIRYCSLSMPVVEMSEPVIQVDEVSIDKEEETPTSPDSTKRCCRNFLIFTDAKSFPESYFPTKKPKYPQRTYCPVTGLPARYRDPITQLPYSNAQAFRYIRERYAMQLEEKSAENVEQRRRK